MSTKMSELLDRSAAELYGLLGIRLPALSEKEPSRDENLVELV